MTLRDVIEQEIREHGPIPFSRYMDLCLYHPELGYYSRHADQFGKAGDFYTSSDVHAVYGRLLARQFHQMWQALARPGRITVCELGPGRGLFARDVLDWSRKKFPECFDAIRYVAVERSPRLREKVQQVLAQQIAARKALVADNLEGSMPGSDPVIVFANEFFDALPVEIISYHGELRVGWNAGRFQEVFVSPSAAECDYMDRYSVHPAEGERVEAAVLAQDYMRKIAAHLPRGYVVVVDYGYTRDELLAGRHRGTLMCYREHSASANPYEAAGEQDITAHVNFTALQEVGETAGLETLGVVTQAQFLMGIGESTQFADALEQSVLPQEQAKVMLQLKHLVTPAGMGETFQVLVMGRNVGEARLDGLTFAR
ncbi:MAG: SAM-dependent methyltransferase [Acidobacteriaceae bacterium]|nr:SAM-dependent methyltransferase [Acidobacteriaceae bacterium]